MNNKHKNRALLYYDRGFTVAASQDSGAWLRFSGLIHNKGKDGIAGNSQRGAIPTNQCKKWFKFIKAYIQQ